ncbi:hypothetical protein D5R81_01505 [Parashewanella spongiae]|uniref:Uncharacterized protein n=1 Tax=Parashewanella spongiae TaxID=342950 RepID=A0A3A6U1I4_9GAMM|nr:hypothetical protein [Parashewanella spongiae]MCL1076777.1 hypothetical protein [Parashewanella spongiae]RJY19298.1 hypothetical protein D5R81_01505 [Parashewanella spongiae]
MAIQTVTKSELAGLWAANYLTHVVTEGIALGPAAPMAPFMALGTATIQTTIQYEIRNSKHADNKMLNVGTWIAEAGLVTIATGGFAAFFRGGKLTLGIGKAACTSLFSNLSAEALDQFFAHQGFPQESRLRRWGRPMTKLISSVPLGVGFSYLLGGSTTAAGAGAVVKNGLRQEHEIDTRQAEMPTNDTAQNPEATTQSSPSIPTPVSENQPSEGSHVNLPLTLGIALPGGVLFITLGICLCGLVIHSAKDASKAANLLLKKCQDANLNYTKKDVLKAISEYGEEAEHKLLVDSIPARQIHGVIERTTTV